MKAQIRTIVLATFFTSLFTTAFAQHRAVEPYSTGLGLRGGFLYGVSAKQFIGETTALEAIVGTRWQGFSLTAMFEYQKPTHFLDLLDWFVGFGVHGGSYENRYYASNPTTFTGSVFALGIDGIVGLEYKINKVPLTFGLDFKPFFDLVNQGPSYLDAGLTGRYVFK